MGLLLRERETFEEYMPGLDGALTEVPLLDLERPDNVGIRLFREAGGPALLIPREHSGLGADALKAMRVQCAIGSRAPSLAIATTMHHFSVASLVDMGSQGTGLEGMFLEAVAKQRLLIASGFAEGNSGQSILTSTMRVRRSGDDYLISGSKKPCSLSRSMDLLTASMVLPESPKSGPEFAVALIPAVSPGIERRPFWKGWVLNGAESDEVILRDVVVPKGLVFRVGDSSRMNPLQLRGFLWFELLITASYVGMTAALVERVVKAVRGGAGDRALLGSEIEGALSALEGVARTMMADDAGIADSSDGELARMLFVRYAVQGALERASARALELLGGMAFIGSPETGYLFAATRGLAFHPPSRTSMSQALADHLSGEALALQ